MKSATKVESRIQSFWARKVDQYPELQQPVERMYRDLLTEDRTENSTHRRLSGNERDLNYHVLHGRFTTNHFRGWHYAA